MAIIGRAEYDRDGDLLAPTRSQLRSQKNQLDGTPTTDPDHYHRHSFRVYSSAERGAAMRAFFSFMEGVRGYSTLSVQTYEHEFGRTVYGATVVYVVELPQMLALTNASTH